MKLSYRVYVLYRSCPAVVVIRTDVLHVVYPDTVSDVVIICHSLINYKALPDAALFGRKIVAVIVIPRQPDMVIMTGSPGQFDRLAPVIKSRIRSEILAPLAHPLVAGGVP